MIASRKKGHVVISFTAQNMKIGMIKAVEETGYAHRVNILKSATLIDTTRNAV